MKKVLLITAIILMPVLCSAQSDKDRERFAYVTTQMKLPKDLKAKLQPIFYAYMKELHAAKDIYNDLKDKNLTAIRKQKITAEQAKQLNTARWRSDEEVLKVRRAYSQKFAAVLSPQQVYYLFSFANDSKSKRQGK
ncbi:MAG: hypothetical protein IJ832_08910 [Bacteroidaceae bacterium]|nr:hypothetical protein [Bacteroidaceae bacterium]